ncbi:MAG: PAS domain S-box protein, partial [bacterium]
MSDSRKTKAQLIEELKDLRARMAEIERTESERKQAEAELQESEKRFRAVFEHAGAGIILAPLDGPLLQTNAAFQRMLGYSAKELCSMTLVDFTHPVDLQSELDFVTELRRGRRDSYRMEKRFVRKDGSVVWGDLTVSLVRDSCDRSEFLIGTVEDITERKQTEEQFYAVNQMLQAIVDASPLAIIALDPDAKVRMWSPAAEHIFGWSEEEVIGQLNPLVPKDKQKEFISVFEKVLAGEKYTGHEVSRRRKDGSLIHASVST